MHALVFLFCTSNHCLLLSWTTLNLTLRLTLNLHFIKFLLAGARTVQNKFASPIQHSHQPFGTNTIYFSRRPVHSLQFTVYSSQLTVHSSQCTCVFYEGALLELDWCSRDRTAVMWIHFGRALILGKKLFVTLSMAMITRRD